MIGFHVFVKTLRESARRPLYLSTLLGIPVALMLIFGAALPNGETDADDAASALAGGRTAAAARAIPTVADDPVVTSTTPLQQTVTVITQRPTTQAPAPVATSDADDASEWFNWWNRGGTGRGGWGG